MRDYMSEYRFWKTSPFFDDGTKKELETLDEASDIGEIEDRFYTNLEFGTGGLRGIMGAGTNRMNRYTVSKATYGLGLYLIDSCGKKACLEKGVAIAYDTRNNSAFFAEVTAGVLSAMGIRVHLQNKPSPTPLLSFAVKSIGAIAGIVITASHNPKEYNGYKVYNSTGCQLVPHEAKRVIDYINSVSDITALPQTANEGLICRIDLTDSFVDAVLKQQRDASEDAKNNLKIIYTPLHGTGRIPVAYALEKCGFKNVITVKEQCTDDGNFPTVKSPNPEDIHALEMGISLGKEADADIVLGTDPDCDRVGVAVKDEEGYTLLTGNQTGALLMDYILENTDISSIHKPAVVKTVVTSELGAEIAVKKGVSVFNTLTGFKYIGEKINEFEEALQSGDALREYTFLFGYEESYGYLAGTHARDKDAAVSCMLICLMAASLKSKGKTLVTRLNELYDEYGYYKDYLASFTLKGKDGIERIQSMMKELRTDTSPFENTVYITDYTKDVAAEEGFGLLPKSDVLKFTLSDGSWIAVRPSGTEPKIKIYYSIKAVNKASAEEKLEILDKTIKDKLKLE